MHCRLVLDDLRLDLDAGRDRQQIGIGQVSGSPAHGDLGRLRQPAVAAIEQRNRRRNLHLRRHRLYSHVLGR
jgi:hypothetical protein